MNKSIVLRRRGLQLRAQPQASSMAKRTFSSLREHVQVTQHGTGGRQNTKSKHPTTPMTHNLDRQATTEQVDALLQSTREMMGPYSIPQHLIAFSGGVDSSLTAALVHRAHDATAERVQAVLGISAAVPEEQVDLAVRVAHQLGIDLKQVPTTEGEDETYLANDGKACLACKTHLYSTLRAIVTDSEHAHASFCLYNGTNADDRRDPTRLGLIAAREFHVRSPLQDLTKDRVRRVARHLGLLNWNYAASPCLRSRLALGVTATAQHLQLMGRAERLVKQRLGPELVDETTNLRARLLAGHKVCIEIDEHLVEAVMSEDWTAVRNMGDFHDVSVRAFKSGSVAVKEESSGEEESPAAVGYG